MNFFKLLAMMLVILMLISGCSQANPVQTIQTPIESTVTIDPAPENPVTIANDPVYLDSKAEIELRVRDLLSRMNLDEKIGQMVQAEASFIRPDEVAMHYIGSVLSGGGHAPGNKTSEAWMDMVVEYQRAAGSTRLGIPIIYGVDAVHGMAKYKDVVIFPHNSALGAANDPVLMERIGMYTAKEMLIAGVTWNFAPCIAVAQDIRWGRTYESFSQNPDRVISLSVPYIKGLQSYNTIATAKHFFGDGGTQWGTGDNGYKIDQGNLKSGDNQSLEDHLAPYKAAINAGARTIMVSFSSINDVKMHESGAWVQKWLKDEQGFTGFVVSDWEGIQQIKAMTYHDQIVKAVNSGIDMLMEPDDWRDALNELRTAVSNGEITMARIDDAVTRIIRVKMENSLFEYPFGCTESNKVDTLNGAKQVAKEAVSKSLVLLKNEKNMLPLKKNAKLILLGDGADDLAMQSGGWTMEWQGLQPGDGEKILSGKTILEGFVDIARQNGGQVFTDVSNASEADAVVLVLSEFPYAEGYGDDGVMDLYSGAADPYNSEAIEAAKGTGLPIITVLISGRPRIVTKDLPDWDAFVMAWLPGTQGDGVAEVLYGNTDFSGTLPFEWPMSTDYFESHSDSEILFDYGYGLKY